MNSVIGFLLLLVSWHAAYADRPEIFLGGTVENGGNLAWCASQGADGPGTHPPSSGGFLAGEYYMLDYAHAVEHGTPPQNFVEPRDWPDSSSRLSRILSEVSPALLVSFRDFLGSTGQILDLPRALRWSSSRQWTETSSLQIIGHQPEYSRCIAVLQESMFPPLQNTIVSYRGYLRAVTRIQAGGLIEYRYQGAMLRYLLGHSTLQLSMLLVHEWLWDHTDRVEVNQRANVFLHSRAIDRMPSQEIRERLRGLGLEF